MKKYFALFGWLLISGSSLGEAGQHTGVGGNPAVPPPTPSSIVIPGVVVQSLQPGLVIFIPDTDTTEEQGQSSDQQTTEDQDESPQ